MRLSPVTPANDIVDEKPQPLFDTCWPSWPRWGWPMCTSSKAPPAAPRELPDRPFDYAALKAYRKRRQGAWMVNNGYDRALADAAVADGADLVAFGRPFIANPDLHGACAMKSARPSTLKATRSLP
jgi:N-ethylmaleimide reductase